MSCHKLAESYVYKQDAVQQPLTGLCKYFNLPSRQLFHRCGKRPHPKRNARLVSPGSGRSAAARAAAAGCSAS